MNDDTIQYILVRKDLNMTHGKMSAQVAHASVGTACSIYRGAQYLEKFSMLASYTTAINEWFNNSYAKVVLEVKTKQKMLNILEKLHDDNVPHNVIRDSCRTELEPEEDGVTMTCVGLVPMYRSMTPSYIKKLQLFK